MHMYFNICYVMCGRSLWLCRRCSGTRMAQKHCTSSQAARTFHSACPMLPWRKAGFVNRRVAVNESNRMSRKVPAPWLAHERKHSDFSRIQLVLANVLSSSHSAGKVGTWHSGHSYGQGNEKRLSYATHTSFKTTTSASADVLGRPSEPKARLRFVPLSR